jgi:acetyl-CoA acetyltransferase
MSSLAREVAVVGVGYSPIARKGNPDPRRLALAASRAALDDAGLRPADIDGMFHFRFDDDIPVFEIARMLGVPDLASHADMYCSGPSGLTSALAAVQAVASGACETALAIRCLTRASGTTGGLNDDVRPVGGVEQFLWPFGWGAGVLPGMGARMQRRFAEFGDTQEVYGTIAINARRWAADNERAVLRDLITMDDYLASRPVVDPLLLFDCDYPVNGACVSIITTTERAADLRQKPVLVDAMAYATGGAPDAAWAFGDDLLYGSTLPCAERLWSRASVTAADVDVAQLYDGFTHITISWIEALGFCGKGEYRDWVDGGRRIGPGGELPTNTSGGHLAEGRVHGLQFLNEAVLQLRGQCGVRQVPDAEVAVVTNAHGPQAGAMVLRT